MLTRTFTLTLFVLLASTAACTFALAEETAGQQLDHAATNVGNATRKTVRAAKDKTCELVDGKVSCLGKKIKHKAQNAADDLNAKGQN